MEYLLGVEVSLDTQNELLDLSAQRLGNIPADIVLTPDQVSEMLILSSVFVMV